jgi:folate-binding protein YgfZ
MDDRTIPVEAGIHERAIDYGKGCYTGQEVIVRIRDRGHVNRHLRQLMLGEVAPPPPGTELHVEGGAKPVGSITTAVRSPRFGQTVALGWVRRGVEGTPFPSSAEPREAGSG